MLFGINSNRKKYRKQAALASHQRHQYLIFSRYLLLKRFSIFSLRKNHHTHMCACIPFSLSHSCGNDYEKKGFVCFHIQLTFENIFFSRKRLVSSSQNPILLCIKKIWNRFSILCTKFYSIWPSPTILLFSSKYLDSIQGPSRHS